MEIREYSIMFGLDQNLGIFFVSLKNSFLNVVAIRDGLPKEH
jgi:hypothetical protein